MKINGKSFDICIHGFRIRKHMRYALALWLLGAGGVRLGAVAVCWGHDQPHDCLGVGGPCAKLHVDRSSGRGHSDTQLEGCWRRRRWR